MLTIFLTNLNLFLHYLIFNHIISFLLSSPFNFLSGLSLKFFFVFLHLFGVSVMSLMICSFLFFLNFMYLRFIFQITSVIHAYFISI